MIAPGSNVLAEDHFEEGRSLADHAYKSIKLAVIRCELEPGEGVTEEHLAAQYHVGRAAVRAALKRLCQEKLVEVALRQRYIIAPITLRHANELFELRLLLEPAAARRFAIDGLLSSPSVQGVNVAASRLRLASTDGDHGPRRATPPAARSKPRPPRVAPAAPRKGRT